MVELEAVDQQSSSSTLFNQFLNHGQMVEMQNNRNSTYPAIEDSPPVEKIVKKIDFKDLGTAEGGLSSEGRFMLLPKSSQKQLSK